MSQATHSLGFTNDYYLVLESLMSLHLSLLRHALPQSAEAPAPLRGCGLIARMIADDGRL